jgi:undecaprenyl-diphosphatase
MDLLQSTILGLIQGTTEWLPVSSTAHLKLIEHFFGLAVTPLFNLVLHLGTVAVLIFYFRVDIKNILVALRHLDFKSEGGMLIPRIVVATIPTAVVGLVYDMFLVHPGSSLYVSGLETIPVIAVTFLIGGSIVFSTKFSKEKTNYLSYKYVILMGIAQGFSIFPGLSRSGVTISTGLLLGLQRQKAFKFSFLLSIPAVIGDLFVEAYIQEGQLVATAGGISPFNVAAALAATVVVGYLAIKLVSVLVQSRKFYLFALYTWSLGIALIVYSLLVH